MKRMSAIAWSQAFMSYRKQCHSCSSTIGMVQTRVGGVDAGVGPGLLPHMKVYVAKVVQARVRIHHVDKYMCHVSEIALDGALADVIAACRKDSHVDLLH